MTSDRQHYIDSQQRIHAERAGRTDLQRCACTHLQALHVKGAETCAAWADADWCACPRFKSAAHCSSQPHIAPLPHETTTDSGGCL